jgi:hypothetical protein
MQIKNSIGPRIPFLQSSQSLSCIFYFNDTWISVLREIEEFLASIPQETLDYFSETISSALSTHTAK